MTRTIQRLEKTGLVRTTRSAADRRSIIVEATEKSLSLRKAVEDAWTELEARTVGALTKEQRKEVLGALAALERNLVGAESRGECDEAAG
jgi:DNA-binding MarR family transcriptional regulator